MSALRLGEEAAQIQVTPSVQMFLAEEHEFLVGGVDGGAHLLDAVRIATTCVRDATAQVALNNRERILQRCAEVLSRLNPRLAHLRLRIEAPNTEGLTVRVDEREIPRGLWSEPIDVLPGVVVVDASAPGRGPFHRAQRLPAGASEVVPVALPALPATEGSAAPVSEAPVRPRETPREAPPSIGLPIVGWSLLGLGVMAGAVSVWQIAVTYGLEQDSLYGTGEYGLAWARYDSQINRPVNGVYQLSTDDVCARASTDAATNPDAALAHQMCESISTARTLAWAFGLSGIALGAASVTLLLVGGRREPPRVVPSAVVAPGFGGASLRVTF